MRSKRRPSRLWGQAAGEIVLDEGKARVIFEVGEVVAGAGEEGINAGDVGGVGAGQEGIDEVRAEEAAGAGDEVTEGLGRCGHGWLPEEQNAVLVYRSGVGEDEDCRRIFACLQAWNGRAWLGKRFLREFIS